MQKKRLSKIWVESYSPVAVHVALYPAIRSYLFSRSHLNLVLSFIPCCAAYLAIMCSFRARKATEAVVAEWLRRWT
jgi:hypothetical protein